MIAFILAAAIVSTVAGKNCCFPDKMSGHVYGAEIQQAVEFVADYTRGKFYSSPLNKSSEVEWVLIDTHTGEQYMKYADGECRKVKVPDSGYYKQCVPSNATKLGHAYYGPKGIVDATAWRYNIGVGELTAVFDKHCFPLLNVVQVEKATFTNIYVGVTDSPSQAELSGLDHDVSSCTDLDILG